MNTMRTARSTRRLIGGGLVLATALGSGWLASARAEGPPSCNAQLVQGCLYFPNVRYAVEREEDAVTYTDITGQPRTVLIAIRRPIGAPVPLPVVIWSHGGAEGSRRPAHSLSEWSETTAQAGYLTVSLAHVPRTDPDRFHLCQAIAAAVPGDRWDLNDPLTCRVFKHLNWDRPHDIRAVLDELQARNARGPLRGSIDLERIAVGGHSSGSSGALTVGGAMRNFTGTPVDLSDPQRRPVAFLAFSPQAPGSEGLFDTDFAQPVHSWTRIARPVLVGTGDGDSTCGPLEEPGSCFGDMPYTRRAAFERLPMGDKYLAYVHDVDAFHGLFGLSADSTKCARPDVTPEKCAGITRLLRSAALAFLDGHVRGNSLALQWLRRGELESATRGAVEWHQK